MNCAIVDWRTETTASRSRCHSWTLLPASSQGSLTAAFIMPVLARADTPRRIIRIISTAIRHPAAARLASGSSSHFGTGSRPPRPARKLAAIFSLDRYAPAR
jgi:hypothetical protein